MPSLSHPTRELLLQTGLQLAEAHGLAAMSVNAIVAEANVAKGTFYVHFEDRTAFLVALHRWFHDRLKLSILNATADQEPGQDRLQRGTNAYLDGCLQGKAVKALLLEARSEPAITDEVQRRNADFAQIAQADFAAMDWPNPEICARLYITMCAEVALIELERGHAEDKARSTLYRMGYGI